MSRQWFANGAFVDEQGYREYFAGGVLINESYLGNLVAPVIDEDGLLSAGEYTGDATLTYQWEEFIASQWEEVDAQADPDAGPADWGDAVDGRDYRLRETASNVDGVVVAYSNEITYTSGGAPTPSYRQQPILL